MSNSSNFLNGGKRILLHKPLHMVCKAITIGVFISASLFGGLGVLADSYDWNTGPGETIDSPTSFVFAGSIFQTIRGSDNKIYTRNCGPSATNCGDWMTDPFGFTPNAIAVAVFQNKIYQSVRGTDDRIYTRYSMDGTNWSGWIQDPISATNDSVTLVVFNSYDRLFQMARGSNNHIYTRFTSDGSNWTSWAENGGVTPNRIAAAEYGPYLVQGVRGETDSKIYIRLSTDGINWSAWERDDGSYTPEAFALASTNDSNYNAKLYEVARGGDGRLFQRRLDINTDIWTQWHTIGETMGNLGLDQTTTVSAPDATRTYIDGPQSILVTMRGNDNRLYWNWF